MAKQREGGPGSSPGTEQGGGERGEGQTEGIQHKCQREKEFPSLPSTRAPEQLSLVDAVCLPGTVLGLSKAVTPLIFTMAGGVDIVILIPNLGKLRPGEVIFSQSHTAGKEKSWDLNSGGQAPEGWPALWAPPPPLHPVQEARKQSLGKEMGSRGRTALPATGSRKDPAWV